MCLQKFGLQVLNLQRAAMAAVHLYNAAQQTKFMLVSWKGIEEMISTWTVEKLFVGNAPTDRDGSWKQYLMVTGISSASFAPNRRKLKREMSESLWKL